MVKVDPNFIEFHRFPGTFIALGVVMSIFECFDRLQHPGIFAISLPFILGGILIKAYLSRWREVEVRRWVAVDEEQHSLIPHAIEQPKPDEAALLIPSEIKLWSTWKVPLLCFGLMLCLTTWLLTLPFYSLPPDHQPRGSVLLVLVVLALCLPASMASLFLCTGYQRIEVTEEGLRVRTGYSKILVKWDEAALFAIYPANRISQREYPPVIYELSSSKAIVRWIRMRPGMPWFRRNHKPLLPFDEYDRQMDALLSLIAARTRLPLYDLR